MQDYTERPERTEARAILRLVSLSAITLEDARELISIPDRQVHALRMFIAVAGKDGASIRSAIAFRDRVMVEFDKLLAAGQVDLSTLRICKTDTPFLPKPLAFSKGVS